MNITIYGKPDCSGCIMAKNYLDQQNIPYDYKELGVDFVREDIDVIAPGARSFPLVFINSRCVGGYQAMVSTLMVERLNNPDNRQLLAE